MAVTKNINLLVSLPSGGMSSNEIKYIFRLNSYGVINLDEYRIVMYLNTDMRVNEMTTSIQSGTVTSNTAFTSISSTYVGYNTVSRPPRIFPTDEQYNVKTRHKFNGGSGVDGGNWSGIEIRFHRTPSLNLTTDVAYTTSYSQTSSPFGSYVSSPKFVLEWNGTDPGDAESNNWQLVQEVTNNSGSLDPNTGVYPINDTDKDDTTALDRNGRKCSLIFIDKDTYIHNTAPGNNYGSNTPLVFTRGDGSNSWRRVLMSATLSGITQYDTINSGQLWIYPTLKSSGGGFSAQLYNVTGSWAELTATWTNSNGLLGATLLGTYTNPTNVSDSTDVYNRIPVSGSEILNWLTTNNGMMLKWQNEDNNQANFEFSSREAATPDGTSFTRPRLLLSYAPGSPPSPARRIFSV